MQNARDMESRIAEILDGKKSEGPSSKKETPDVITDDLIVECKHRKKLPRWLISAHKQAVSYWKPETEKVPVAVLHQKYWNHSGDLVLLNISDLCRLLEG